MVLQDNRSMHGSKMCYGIGSLREASPCAQRGIYASPAGMTARRVRNPIASPSRLFCQHVIVTGAGGEVNMCEELYERRQFIQ